MRTEIVYGGRIFNMIEDGAYRDDNGYYVVHAYCTEDRPDLQGWVNSYYVRAKDSACKEIVEIRPWCPYHPEYGFL